VQAALAVVAGAAVAFAAVRGAAPVPATGALPVVARADDGVFDRPQRAVDTSGVPEVDGLSRSTLRLLAPVPGARERLYAARDPQGARCLLEVDAGDGRFEAACAPSRGAVALSLLWSRGSIVSGARSSPHSGYEVRHFRAAWQADGTLGFRSTVLP
jgi:hypothetical protein